MSPFMVNMQWKALLPGGAFFFSIYKSLYFFVLLLQQYPRTCKATGEQQKSA